MAWIQELLFLLAALARKIFQKQVTEERILPTKA
jgi:hypothetical protein